jgi:hypothetical protein
LTEVTFELIERKPDIEQTSPNDRVPALPACVGYPGKTGKDFFLSITGFDPEPI